MANTAQYRQLCPLHGLILSGWLELHAGREQLDSEINNIRDMYSKASPAATHSSFPLQTLVYQSQPSNCGPDLM